MIGPRVAVAPGRHAVRIACTTAGAPRLLAELPTHLAADLDADVIADTAADPAGGPTAACPAGQAGGPIAAGGGAAAASPGGRPGGPTATPGGSPIADPIVGPAGHTVTGPGGGSPAAARGAPTPDPIVGRVDGPTSDRLDGRRGAAGPPLDHRAQRCRAALGQILGPDVAEVVVVHPPGRPPASVQSWLDAATAVAPRFRRVAAPVAATACTPARAVLDVGRSGAEATLLQAGRIVARRSSGVGGDRLDLAVRALLPGASAADARRVREALSLHPETRYGSLRVDAEQLRAALTSLLDEAVAALAAVVASAGEPVPVLLTGGVARCPLLAERVDAAGFAADVRVAPQPDLAAVLGALNLGPPPPTARAVEHAPAPRYLPALPPVGRVRRWGSAALTAMLVGGLAGAGTAVAMPVWAPTAAAPTAAPPAAGVLVQYGYRLDLPAGWAHTGGFPERRRSLLTRVGAPQGTDLIAVERTPLGYDAAAEPERAAAEMRAAFDQSVAAGARLSGYGNTEIGGRAVTAYRQQERDGAVVEWYVVLDGDAQLSVGCRHTPTGTDAVRSACAVVVGSVRRA
jgi:type VII secretion-associated protein (TIGR03931 family)